MATTSSVIYGCAGPVLDSWERGFFAEIRPFGFILFARNCQDPARIRSLVDDLRSAVDRPDTPVLIDQEGGRVARLRPPHWREAPPAEVFGQLAEIDIGRASEAVRLNARLLALELRDLGITVDCVPCLDLRLPEGHGIIGDRAFGSDPELVATLGRAQMEGVLEAGVMPVVKHIPGHGRARVDSHESLPVVEAAHAELSASDFRPFKALVDAPWAMTAHVIYSAIDSDRPATTSAKVIGQVIRGEIGFDGLLLTDDLSMKALSGSFTERARSALDAGCDIALHCNGDRSEMESVAKGLRPLSEVAQERAAAAAARLGRPPLVSEAAALKERLSNLLAA